MNFTIRTVARRAIGTIHAMNESALPHVNSVSEDWFAAQIEARQYFRAACHAGRALAFLLAMDETADYDSLNFLWFRDHYPRFVYVDRIVVHADYRGAGLGAALYADLLQWSRGRTPRLACEVNLRPSNEPSLRFHARQGFTPVGTQETDGGRKTVSLMIRELCA